MDNEVLRTPENTGSQLWTKIYPNGTVESSDADGSVIWISSMHGWNSTSTLGPKAADGTRKVATSLVDTRGNVMQRNSDDHALDRIVDDQCLPESTAGANPVPCASVNADVAVLKSREENQGYLVMPTLDITGVEDPRLLDPKSPNYFAQALDAKNVETVKDRDRTDEIKDLTSKGMTQADAEKKARQDIDGQIVAATVNSAAGRSQDRLHIHDDFILPDVQANLKSQLDAGRISDKSFEDVGVLQNGHDYRAMWVDADANGALGQNDPFKLVNASLPADKKDSIDLQTVAVVPETKTDGTNGFIILTGTADPATGGGTAAGEEIQHRWVVP